MTLRLALRRLRKSPLFTLAAVLTLGVGIAAATAMFSLIDAVLLRPLPFHDPHRLVWVWASHTDRDRAFFSIPDLADVRRQSRSFDEIAAVAPWGVNLSGNPGTPAERLLGARISPSAFALLGAAAAQGRTLAAGDEAPALRHVVVLGHALWQRRFGGDRAVIGRAVVLDGDSYTVVGVLPPSFQLPNFDGDLWAPLSLDDDPRRTERGSNFLRTFGRLAPGVTARQAAEDLAGITGRIAAEYPETDAKMAPPHVIPLDDELTGSWRGGLVLLLGAVALVLLVACASFAGAHLARVAARRDELSLRAALGATRARLLRELFAESALLALLAGLAGALLAPWILHAVVATAPAGLPRAAEAAIDGRALAFSFAVAAICALLTGIAPALDGVRGVARAARGGVTLTGRARGARELFVVAQLALSLVLLAGAGLLSRGATRLAAVAPGFDPRGVSTMRLSLPRPRYPTATAIVDLHRAVADRIAALPGVARVASGSYAPLAGALARTDFTIVGRPPATAADLPGAQQRFVGPGWFDTLGIPVVAGRAVELRDDPHGQSVVVIDRALARRFLPGEDPVGKHLRLDDGVTPRDVEIVGVVGDVPHFVLGEEPLPTIYVPLAQAPPNMVGPLAAATTIVVKTNLPGDQRLREAVARVDSGIAASRPIPLAESLAAQLAPRRLALGLVALLAVTSLLLAAGGLAAAVAWQVSRRRREIGVRMVLGGTAGRVAFGIVLDAAKLVAAGTAAGVVVSLVAARALAHASPDLGAPDPLPFIGAALVLAAVGLLSAWLPARRAARIDPAIALRST